MSSKDIFTARSNFAFTSEDKQAAISRFCETYNDGRNKSQLIRECIAAGFMMKETGLLDFLLNLDKEPKYQQASDLQKTHIIKNELASVFGLTSLPPANAVEEENATNQDNQNPPAQQEQKPQPTQQKARVPKFGQSGKD
ncbi:TPA: hypothetical protein ACVU5P_004196 [Vibrio parahaemolyticus]